MTGITLGPCPLSRVPEIRAIFNEAIANTTALYESEPRSIAAMQAWFATKTENGWPIIGAFADDDSLAGFATYGPFRPFSGYQFTVEHSIYLHSAHRGKGLGKLLLSTLMGEAARQGVHTMIGGIDSRNTASIALHRSLGFTRCAVIREAGFKAGAWLDLEFHQLILPDSCAGC